MASLNDDLDGLLAKPADDDAPPSPWRFWILGQFMIFTMLQSFAWAIPGAITEALMDPTVYGVSQFTTELWLLWGSVFFCVGCIPFSFWLDRPGGLRGSIIFSIGLIVAGAVIRSAVRDASLLSVAILHISYVLNGLAGVVSMGAVGKISEDWYPRNERATATAWGSEANPFGAAIVFLVGPAMVSTIDMAHVQSLNTLLLALALANLACVVIFYPAHPPRAPSASAGVARDAEARFSLRTLRDTLLALARSRECALLFVSYGLTQGFSSSWVSTLQPNLAPFLAGASAAEIQWRAGIISFASCTAGNVAGLFVGSFVDRFRGHRAIMVSFNAAAAACFAVFAAVVQGWFASALSPAACYQVLFWSGTAGGLFCYASIPLYFELSLEAAFPLPSGTVVIVLTTMMNLASVVFYTIPVGAWMNWALSGVLAATALAFAFLFDDGAKRARFDALAAEARGAQLTAADKLALAAGRGGGGGGGGEALLAAADA